MRLPKLNQIQRTRSNLLFVDHRKVGSTVNDTVRDYRRERENVSSNRLCETYHLFTALEAVQPEGRELLNKAD